MSLAPPSAILALIADAGIPASAIYAIHAGGSAIARTGI